jgi:hypothetical protein
MNDVALERPIRLKYAVVQHRGDLLPGVIVQVERKSVINSARSCPFTNFDGRFGVRTKGRIGQMPRYAPEAGNGSEVPLAQQAAVRQTKKDRSKLAWSSLNLS